MELTNGRVPHAHIKTPVGVLVSGDGSNLQALINACADPLFPAAIQCVISNVAGAYALERARRANIPLYTLSQKAFTTREAWESAITHTLRTSYTDSVSRRIYAYSVRALYLFLAQSYLEHSPFSASRHSKDSTRMNRPCKLEYVFTDVPFILCAPNWMRGRF